ncbi:MAG: DUF1499 domain-containing protein [Gemmatimonadales bacterium]|nr:DUF1499 domain-containing protein [Gemmatimonadales bacterium]
MTRHGTPSHAEGERLQWILPFREATTRTVSGERRNKIETRLFRRLRHDHVSSEPGEWRIHRVAPFHTLGDPVNFFRRLRAVVAAMPRTHIVAATDDYLHAVCRTRLGFRDDLEFRWCPSEGIAHVTSASRVGLFDFGVNRRRVERVRRNLGG